MNTPPEALRIADELCAAPERSRTSFEAAAELRRLHELNQELVEALKGLDEAYCRAGAPLTKDERHEDRMRLIAARDALAKASGSATQTGETE